MPFKAGAITGEALLNTQSWDKGINKVNSSSKSITGVLGTLAKVGFGAVAAGMTAAVYQANEYQKEFANVSTLTSQNTKELQNMSISLLSLDSSLGSTRELTKSMYDAISAGAKPGKEALDTVASSAKFAKAAMADNAASVKLLSATVNAYGRDVINTEKASDIFFTTIKDGVITGEELAATIGQSIPLFASMKIPVEQLASGMAAMTKQGVSASESTTQLNAIVNAFLKPSTALTEVLEEQGYQSGQAFIQTEGLTGALDLLKTATESGKFETADLVKNIRGMKGVLALSGEGAKIYNETLKDMESAAGATNEAFGKQEKTFATLKNELGKTAIIAGNVGKAFVDKIATGAQSGLEAINEFILKGKGLDKISSVIAKIAGVFSVWKTIANEVYELFEDNLFDAIEDIKETFNELFTETVKQGDVFDALSSVTNLLGAGFNILISVVKLGIKGFMNLIKVGIQVTKTIGSIWDLLSGKKTFSDVKKTLSDVATAYGKFTTDYMEDTENVVNTAVKQWDNLTDNSKDNSKKFADSWKRGSEETKQFITDNYKAAVSGVENSTNEIVTIIGGGVEEGSLLWKEGMGNINEETKEASKENKSLWQEWMEGWNEYVSENLDSTEEKFQFWAESIMDIVSTTMSGLSEITDLYFQNEADKLTLAKNAELEELNSQYALEQAALQEKLDKGLISEATFNTQSEALKTKFETNKTKVEKDALKKKNDLAKKEFKTNKAFQIANVYINLASAIMGFWAGYASIPIAGAILAGVMTGIATGIANTQAGLISQQQFVPSYARGTKSHPGGPAMVNEQGGEIIDLPAGSRVIPHDLSEQMFNAGNSIQLFINNPVIREKNDITKLANAVSSVLGKQLRTA
jgi:TP901 family phage tail tape measure protein